MSGNRDTLTRALRILKIFSERNVTTRQVANELKISRPMAARWIRRASTVLPITEVGTLREGAVKGPESVVYGVMKDSQN